MTSSADPRFPLPTTRNERSQILLEGLNPQQAAAVAHSGSPLLIVAGAGSGKTSVLTRRIAWLLAERNVSPSQILAITFTNKAAAEMRERVVALVGHAANSMWVSTFHSTCVRILRTQANLLPGMNSNFSIYDADDSRRLLTMIIKDMDLNPKKFAPRGVGVHISNLKNELIDADQAAADAEKSGDDFSIKLAAIYRAYQQRLRASNSFDFDDLIGETVNVLQNFPAVAEYYRRRFRHVLVDEYQDTNHAQYLLVRELVGTQPNPDGVLPGITEAAELCVVGDADQSIYAFRGATIRNIEEFERDYPDATTILLEQNYRSTQTILSAANAVISKNTGRREKKLWTDQGDGPLIVGYVSDTEYDEATFIVDEIDSLTSQRECTYGDIAIFYRTNTASRALEEACIRHGIPYKVVGGLRFYERKEIRDVIAYLRVIENSDDSVSLRRILNVPKRGIGDRAEACVAVHAESNDITFWQALCDARDGKVPFLNTRAEKQITGFLELVEGLKRDYADEGSEIDDIADLVEAITSRTGYREELAVSNDPQDGARLDNLNEMVSVAKDFVIRADELAAEFDELSDTEGLAQPGSLTAFLERVSLVADADQIPDDDEGVVTLMTLHTAKGLEFPVVFVTGWEDGLFPHMRALGDPAELNEERRLAYVGITRAKQRLFLSRAVTRSAWGQPVTNPQSRFLTEIPGDLIDWRRTEPIRHSDFGGRSGVFGRDRGYGQGRTWGQSRASEPGFNANFGSSFTGARSGDYRPAPASRKRNNHLVLAVGDRVNHQKFGLGKVISIEGSGSTERVTFDFGSAGTIKLMTIGGLPMEKL